VHSGLRDAGVRAREVAAGRAIIPASESPGIRADDHRRNFLVKINANIGNSR